MPTEPAVAPLDAPQQRLHPMSWLFELIASLRQFIVPLVALLFFGQRNDYQWWPLVGVGVLAVASVAHYFTYRYRIEARSLVVRSGLLQRHLREIPFARIQNVALHQTVLHRLFGVAEVRLESAGGTKPEAQMKVLRLDDAMALEELVRRRGSTRPGSAAEAGGGGAVTGEAVALEPAARALLALPPGEVLRLGLVSNRGLLVLGGAFAAMSQFNGQLFGNLMEYWGESLFGWAESHHFDIADYVLAAGSLVVAFLALMRVLSVLIALLQYFGFSLLEQGRRLTVERGLLSRLRTSVPRRRIQAWTLEEGVVHRLLKRRSLHVDTATGNAEGGQQRGFRDVAPIATPAACDELVRHLLPRASWPMADWSPVHRLAWVRLATTGIVVSLVATTLLCLRFGAWGLLALAWTPWSLFVARRHAARAGFACDAELVAWRAGWWSRRWRFAEIGKLQALRLSRSPLDRLYGMATLYLDTAGAGAFSGPLRLPYLREADARALYRSLGAEVARRKLRW